jgi:hypothetical protein
MLGVFTIGARAAACKKGAKVGQGTAGGGGKGGGAFADVAIGRLGAETRCSRM